MQAWADYCVRTSEAAVVVALPNKESRNAKRA
jgi:hypothetical protein